MKKFSFIVTVTVNDEVTKKSLANFIRDAVGAWGGGLRPEDPLFEHKKVTVKEVKQ